MLQNAGGGSRGAVTSATGSRESPSGGSVRKAPEKF